MSRPNSTVELWKNKVFISVYSVYTFVLFVQNCIALLATSVLSLSLSLSLYIYIYIHTHIIWKHRTLGLIGPPTALISPFIRLSTVVPFPYHVRPLLYESIFKGS